MFMYASTHSYNASGIFLFYVDRSTFTFFFFFFFKGSGAPRDLPSSPTRRSPDLCGRAVAPGPAVGRRGLRRGAARVEVAREPRTADREVRPRRRRGGRARPRLRFGVRPAGVEIGRAHV